MSNHSRSTGNDIVRYESDLTQGAINLGAGDDKLLLQDNGATVTIYNVETVIGGDGTQKILFNQLADGVVINLGDGGSDTVDLDNYREQPGHALQHRDHSRRLQHRHRHHHDGNGRRSDRSGFGRGQAFPQRGLDRHGRECRNPYSEQRQRSDRPHTAATRALVDLGGGTSDELVLKGVNNTITIANAESVLGSSASTASSGAARRRVSKSISRAARTC